MGSNISIVQPGVSRCDVSVTSLITYGVTGEALDIKGRHSVSFELYGRQFRHKFFVRELPTDAAVLLSTDFLQETGAAIDFECGKLSLTGIGLVTRAYSGSPFGPQHPLSSRRIKRDTALNPIKGGVASRRAALIQLQA